MLEGKKFDTGKNKLGLIDPRFLWEMGQNLTHGATQYGENNWQDVENPKRRYKDALLRHLLKYLGGNDKDKQTGFSELVMIATNAMFLYYFQGLELGIEYAGPCQCDLCNTQDKVTIPEFLLSSVEVCEYHEETAR